MTWGGWAEWSAHGGHPIYVWAAYVVTLGVLLIEAGLVALRSHVIRRFLDEARLDAGVEEAHGATGITDPAEETAR